MEFYWEGWQPEPVSPELALVDPVLRERLLSNPRPAGNGRAGPLVDWVEERLVLPAAPMPEPARSEAVRDGGQMRRGDVIAWSSFTASCGTALALVILAHSQHLRQIRTGPPAAPAVASVTTYTPPARPVDQRTESEKRRLAALLRSPMRDPFARPSWSR